MYNDYESFDDTYSLQDAVRQWAWVYGQEERNINSQWISSPFDSWERNPHYCGEEQPHPEEWEAYED